MRASASHCTWFPWCTEPAAHTVERYTADGVVLRELVCDRHLSNARAHGFEERAEGRGESPGPRHEASGGR